MEDKDLICRELVSVLQLTRDQADVVALRYEIHDNNDETVTVHWDGGGTKRINVTADSGCAMIRDIMGALQ